MSHILFNICRKVTAFTLAGLIVFAQLPALAVEAESGPAQLEKAWEVARKMAPAAEPQSGNDTRPLTLRIERALAEWKAAAPGLDLMELCLTLSSDDVLSLAVPVDPPDLVILRIDPELYEFTLHMASEDGAHRSLAEHAALHGLTAAINAGMYLPDNLTNTGYMQSSTHTNNPRIVSRFGVFFVAEPNMDSLPKALMLEKSDLGENPAKFLTHYQIGVQNFRLLSAAGEVLWPESQNIHSISALALDKGGKALMILCRFQLSPADFSRLLLALPLDCATAMYLEGGSQAGLLLKLPGAEPGVWRGKRNSILALDGPADAAVPNVLGVRARPKEASPNDD